MDKETKNLLTKILIWGGGAFLVFMGLTVVWKIFWGILSLPLWVPLLIGGGGYYLYRRLKRKNKTTEERTKGHDPFDFE